MIIDTKKQQDDIYEDNKNVESVIEMFVAAIKVSLFCFAVYSLKSVFLLIQEMFYMAHGSLASVLIYVCIPSLILAIIVFLILNHIKNI